MISDFLHRRELARIGRDVGDKLDAHPRVQRIAFDDVKVPMQIYCYQDFMTAGECAELIRMIDADAIPSELYRAGAGADQNDFRTSYSCNLDRWHPDVLRIDDRICGLTGIDSRRGETLQGQRYAVGQQFKAHHDYFHTDQPRKVAVAETFEVPLRCCSHGSTDVIGTLHGAVPGAPFARSEASC